MKNVFTEEFQKFLDIYNISIDNYKDLEDAIFYYENIEEIVELGKHNEPFDEVLQDSVHPTTLSDDEVVSLSKKEVCDLIGQIKKETNQDNIDELIFLLTNEINYAFEHLSLFYAKEEYQTDVYKFKQRLKDSLKNKGFEYNVDKMADIIITNSFTQGNLYMETLNTDDILVFFNSSDNSGGVLTINTKQDLEVFIEVISNSL